jgi:hypothetical protein
MDSMDDLAREWAEWKAREDKARENRVLVEERICALHKPREEGSESFKTAGGYRVKLVSKLKYRCDLDMLKVLTSDWDSELVPIKTKVEADETKLRMIRNNAPQVWAKLAPAITTEPAKTGVTIEPPQGIAG